MKPQPRVLPRPDAVQLVQDLAVAIENVIEVAEDSDDAAKILAYDTIALLHGKRCMLQRELACESEVQS